MCNGVYTTHGTHAHRQSHGQIHIINHRTRQNLGITARLLDSIRGLPQDGRHFAPGIRSRDRNMRQARPNANRFSQPRRAATANGHDAVSPLGFGIVNGRVGDVGWRVHGGIVKDAGDLAVENGLEVIGLADLLGRGEYERRLEFLAL